MQYLKLHVKKFLLKLYDELVLRRNLFHIGDKRFLMPVLPKLLKDATSFWPLAIDKFTPKVVFDVGAHKGIVSSQICELYHPDVIVLIEPITEFYQELKDLSLAKKQMVFNCALGESRGKQTFNIVASSTSSSLLKIKPNLNEVFNREMNIEKEVEVDIKTLDDIYLECEEKIIDLIKIDVQGYELNVLKGGRQALQNTKFVVLEVLLFNQYDDQASFEEIYLNLQSAGFKLRTTVGWLYDKSGLPLQFDAVFINQNIKIENK